MNGMTVYMHRTILLCDIVTSSGQSAVRSAPSILLRGQGANYRGVVIRVEWLKQKVQRVLYNIIFYVQVTFQ